MPKKKVVRRSRARSSKRKIAKIIEPVQKKVQASARGLVRGDRIKVVARNLLLFGILFVISVAVALISKNAFVDQLFWIVAIITAFVAVALILVLLIVFFMKQMKK